MHETTSSAYQLRILSARWNKAYYAGDDDARKAEVCEDLTFIKSNVFNHRLRLWGAAACRALHLEFDKNNYEMGKAQYNEGRNCVVIEIQNRPYNVEIFSTNNYENVNEPARPEIRKSSRSVDGYFVNITMASNNGRQLTRSAVARNEEISDFYDQNDAISVNVFLNKVTAHD